ncbi:MAG: hypothetical protein WAO04_01370 [Candidatus Sulfotelmatobacter sp.]
MSDTWESGLASIRSDSILQKQVSTVNPDLDAVAEKSDDAVTRR